MWKTVKLGDICDISIGKTPSRGEKRFWDRERKTDNVWLSIADLTSVNGKYISDSKEYVSDEGARLFSPVLPNTLVMSFKLSIGKLAFTQRELRTNEAIAALPIKNESLVSKEFLYHYLSSMNWNTIAGNDEKVKGKTLNKKKLNSLEVVLPPLAEQQRIVAKLDAAFSEIDRAIEINKERYKEVKTLIAKSQNQLFLSISTAASVMRLGDVAKFENGDRGKNYPSKKYQIEEGIPFVNAGDFSLDGEIETESMVYISEERFDLLGAGKFTIDDVLFCLRGSLGKSAINKSIEVGAIASSLVILRAKKNIISSDYLFAYMRSDIVKNLIEQTAGGAAQPNLSAKVVSNYEIPVPPMEEQQRLSDKFWLFRQKGSDVLDSISQKSQRLNALKAAILAQELNPSEAA